MKAKNISFAKGHRGFFKYHRDWGYSFRYNMYARYLSSDSSMHSYEIKTNEQGFRCGLSNVEFATSKRQKILLVGCSYAAGDGVSNEKRFSDLLMDINEKFIVYNAALPGSGHDQQLLILQDLISELNPNIVLFAPSTFCANRNLVKERSFFDPLFGKNSIRAKPFFELNGETIEKNCVGISRFSKDEQYVKSEQNFLGKLIRYFNRPFAQMLARRELEKIYRGRHKSGLLITNRIIRQISNITSSANAHLIVMPLPTEHDLIYRFNSPMTSYFMELSKQMNYSFFSLEELLKQNFSQKNRSLFLENDGHYSMKSHNLIANYLSEKLEDRKHA